MITKTFTFTGPPVTPEMQQLFARTFDGAVVGIVRDEDFMIVQYESGLKVSWIIGSTLR